MNKQATIDKIVADVAEWESSDRYVFIVDLLFMLTDEQVQVIAKQHLLLI
jgi:hypothetical protein